jgi:hypothetical protein
MERKPARTTVKLDLDSKTIATIDRLRGQLSRGRYVDLVVKLCPVVADEWLKNRDPNGGWIYGE